MATTTTRWHGALLNGGTAQVRARQLNLHVEEETVNAPDEALSERSSVDVVVAGWDTLRGAVIKTACGREESQNGETSTILLSTPLLEVLDILPCRMNIELMTIISSKESLYA